MRPCFKQNEIPREIREELPVIDNDTFREHFCTECPYYAGRVDGIAHCMQKNCVWDDPDERFSPVLRQMTPIIGREYEKAKEGFLEATRKKEIMDKMFIQEDLEEARERDVCYRCGYRRQGPCVGFCYMQMTANPKDPLERV